MTRSTIQDKRYCLPPAKGLKKYEEKFPEETAYRPRIPSCPTVLPSYINRDFLQEFEDTLAKVREETFAKLNAENRVGHKVRRRHSWSVGTENARNRNIENNRTNLILQRKISGESRRSSVASVPEVIEECSSDEEMSHESTEDYDYMHCLNCSRSSSTSSLENAETHNIQYCYKCKHLYQAKSNFASTYKEGRRSSWGGESTQTSSPRRSRRSSLTDSTDLPIIAEPFADEETNDTADLKKLVELDINKLLKFNRGVDMR